MPEKRENLSFEEALKRLEEASEKLRSGELTLEQSAGVYEEAARDYELCRELLAKVRAKIEIYRPQTGETEEL